MPQNKSVWLSCLVLFFFLGACFSPFIGSKAALAAVPFPDVPSSHWAYKHVLKMSSREVVAGYQDGTFKPDNAVTQLEAVLMAVRNMEKEDEIAKIDASRPLPFSVPGWAQAKAKKELLFAVDKGLIVPGEQNFAATSLATRAWMTQLMIRMIGKDTEAQLYAHQNSGFKDDSSIPERYRGYINAAVNYEIIAGFSDQTFKPNAIVTRAQSVVMLGKCEKYLNLNNTLTGKIISFNPSHLVIATDEGTKTLSLASGVLAFDQNGSLINITQIQPSAQVVVTVKNNQAKMLELMGTSAPVAAFRKLTGKVVKINPEIRLLIVEDEKGSLYTRTIAPNVPVTDSQGKTWDFASIPENAQVELSLNLSEEVVAITLLTSASDSLDQGIIAEIDQNKKLIILKNGNSYQAFKYSSLTEVEIEGLRFATVEDLLPGDEVKITLENNIITKIKLIKAKQELTLKGQVIENLYARKLLLIETADKKIQAFKVADDVQINIGNIKAPALADIVKGDNIEAVISGGEITSITVNSRYAASKISATVVAVDITSRTLVLKDNDGRLLTYEVSKAADIKIDNQTASLADIKKDMKIRIELLGDKIIYVENAGQQAGTIISVNSERSLISVKEGSGFVNTYKVINNADIQIQNITRPKLSDLKADDYIEFSLNSEEIITGIKVRRVINYEVTSASSSYLRVVDSQGRSDYIEADNYTEIIIPGLVRPGLGDFRKGDTIKVTFLGFKVEKIELAPVLTGQITGIDTYSGTITITTLEGKTARTTFASGSQIIDQGQKYYTLRYLSSGDRVKITENADGSINIYLMSKIRTRFAEFTSSYTELLVKRTSGYTYDRYSLVANCYIHKGNTLLSYRDLAENDWIDIYVLDNTVYEIEKI
ncbi:S-layer homology domain-containing protein [Thermosyntropha lipolytica DSM 11003]|uniref:S-layer homology domain-containing protein n=1 Tax=Thermosyntropha lipolytica DSM 11003 TaxID=1123382 RepID=A0A1M5Q2M5_9FIRM|nr:S-layer homology domain-containing protein [Thermosyntropha lipolytica]SHH08011.1 S-layer homology domain-containing protein [Thermosyntropha lipolytica DSM 11003]